MLRESKEIEKKIIEYSKMLGKPFNPLTTADFPLMGTLLDAMMRGRAFAFVLISANRLDGTFGWCRPHWNKMARMYEIEEKGPIEATIK